LALNRDELVNASSDMRQKRKKEMYKHDVQGGEDNLRIYGER
jgi:hypothetical protein